MAKSSWDWNAFRLAVIEAGIRGELTADWRAANPDVEPAHVLLERIAEEKAELIRTKQIRKEKPLPPISLDEVPFDIPSNWEWGMLGEIATTQAGVTPKRTEPRYWEGEISWYKSGELPNGIIDFDSEEKITEEAIESGAPAVNPVDSVLIAMYAGSDNVGLLKRPGCTNQAVLACCVLCEFSPEFLMYSVLARRKAMQEHAWGTAQQNLSKEIVRRFPLPIPSPAEQQEIVRILSALDSGESGGPVHPVVARIQKLEQEFRALADEYKSQEKWLADLRSALLQEAISGQLTADWRTANPNVEPAHVLLELIAEEKAELIRTKQIRKEKPLPPISPDEVPFDIPSTWEWIKIGTVTREITKGSSPKWQGVDYVDESADSVLFVTSENVRNRHVSLAKKKYVDSRFNELSERSILQSGDVLTNIVGASIGRTAVWEESTCANVNQAVCIMRPVIPSCAPFIMEFLSSPTGLAALLGGTFATGRGNLSLGEIANMVMAIPPQQEQKVILELLREKLMNVEALIYRLSASEEAAQMLMKSKLAEVFEPAMAD